MVNRFLSVGAAVGPLVLASLSPQQASALPGVAPSSRKLGLPSFSKPAANIIAATTHTPERMSGRRS